MAGMTTLATRLKTVREAKGWSQSELARRAGVTAQSIQIIEAGKVRRPSNIVQIAKALGIDPTELQEGGELREPPIKDESDIQSFLERIEGLTIADVDFILRQIRVARADNAVAQQQSQSHDRSAPANRRRVKAPS